MPNFAYTNTTQFRPFSFEEQLRPLLMYTQAHQAVEEAYSELDSQANAIGSLANETNDPVTYARYKSYEASLRNQADILAKNGLTPGSRKSLLDLKGRYAKEITPIQNAITRRRELADEQRKAILQNPTLMFQRDMNSVSYDSSLDRFLENPDYDYGQQYSGALLTQQVSQAASNLAKELVDYKPGKKLDAFTNTFFKDYGFSREQVLDAINNPNRATSQPVLNAIVEQVIGSSGMSNWADTPTMNRAYRYARQGLWSAIGQDQVSPYEDYGARLAAQEASKKRLMNYQNQQKELNGLSLNPRSVYSQRQRTEAEKNFQDNVKKYKDYFTTDANGKIRLTKKGWEEYNRKVSSMTGKPMVTPEGTTILTEVGTKYSDSPFKTFLDSLGMRGMSNKGYGPWQAETAGSLWSKYMENPVAATVGYDANKYTEYYYSIDPSERDVWKGNILGTAINGKFEEVDFDSKSGQYKPTGKTISVEDLNSDKYEVLGTSLSKLGAYGRGNTATIKDDKGNIRTIKLNPGINERSEDAAMQYINYAAMLEQIPDEGGFVMDPDRGQRYVTREQADNEYYRALDTAHSYWSQLGVTNKTKPQEFGAYSW